MQNGARCQQGIPLPAWHRHSSGEVVSRAQDPSPALGGRWVRNQSVPLCCPQVSCSWRVPAISVKVQVKAPAPAAGGLAALLHARVYASVCLAIVPSVPGSARLCVDACPRDAVRPCVACISDDLSPYNEHFSKQNFVFLLLLFLISLGPFHLPPSSSTPHFIRVLFDPFF